MKHSFSVILSIILAVVSVLTGCDEKVNEPAEKKQPAGYIELIDAYRNENIFETAVHASGLCRISFSDGYSLTVAESAMKIHDCTSESPATVTVSDGWWCVGGKVLGIRKDSSLSPEESFPVYVYFDEFTLHMYISNGQKFTFRSLRQQEKEEMERRQNIPVIYINTGGKGIYDKENYVDGTITIKDPEKLYSDVTEFSAAMGIRGRGNSTWSFPKKPWKVKLKEKASIFGMGADKEWCLLANYTDRTLIRNILAMKLSEICGFAWTPHMYSVHVYLNDQYQGVYTFCEHKKVSKDRVDIDVDAGDVYLEIEQQQDEITCWWTGMGVPMMFSDPEEPSAELLSEVKKYFDDFEKSLYSSDIADQDKGYAAYIDVDSFIDYYIVQEVAKNTDGNLRKSSFITKRKGGKLVMHHLWDFDLTFGNSGGLLHEPEGFFIKDYNPGWHIGDNWFNRMMTDPAFVESLQVRWKELYPQLQSMVDFIDEQAEVLDKAQQQNFQKWSIWESVDWVECPSLGSYEAEVEFLKEFYSARLKWLDREINKL